MKPPGHTFFAALILSVLMVDVGFVGVVFGDSIVWERVLFLGYGLALASLVAVVMQIACDWVRKSLKVKT